jgi:hypothetical protein
LCTTSATKQEGIDTRADIRRRPHRSDRMVGVIVCVSTDWLSTNDQQAITQLLDPAYLGTRDDLLYLAADTINRGRRP